MAEIGRVVGERWQLVAPIGGGAMGTVWRARDRRGGPDVAVKLMAKATRGLAAFEERFAREAKSSAAVRHPNVVAILDHGTTESREPYLVMELLDGESLGARIERPPAPSAREAIGWAAEALAGLEAVHGAGIVHRDLKPDNVFLARGAGGDVAVKLLDFGVSRVATTSSAEWESLTRSGEVLGTAGYMAPEQRASAHDVDRRADLYSVGVVLYEALAGCAPFSGANFGEVLLAAAAGRAEPLSTRVPSLGRPLSDVVMRALARDPEGRWADARSMREALHDALGSVPEDAACVPTAGALAMAARAARGGEPTARVRRERAGERAPRTETTRARGGGAQRVDAPERAPAIPVAPTARLAALAIATLALIALAAYLLWRAVS